MKISVPIPKFNELESKLTLESIPEGHVTNHIILDNKKYAVVGGCGSGNCGWKEFYIHEIIPLEIYTGELVPMKYGEHFKEVTAGNRERCYTGMLIKCEGIQHVFVGEKITVECSNSEKQLEIF